PTSRVPILSWNGDDLVCRYLRYFIEVGQQKAGEPLTLQQVQALDTFDGVLRRPDLPARFELRRGDILFANNRWVLHNRTAFEDHPEPERRRHLVRLWLKAAGAKR